MVTRPLTTGEIALARTIFADSVDYTTVTVSDQKFMGIPFLPEGTAMAPNGSLFMPGCYKDDYSREDTLWQGTFLHEMTHVWQYQNKVLNPIPTAAKLAVKHKFDYAAAYNYILDEKKDLLDYNMEQQATIVQDYFVLQQQGMSIWDRSQNACDDAEKLRLYEKVLKNFIADPAYAKRTSFPAFGLGKPKPPKPPKAA
jgi:hypothetical protein